MADAVNTPGSLGTMGKIWEGIKHIGLKALKWGAILGGAALLMGVIPGVGTLLSWAAGTVPGLGAVTSALGIESAAGIVATAGVMVGGLFGAAVGASGVSEAVTIADDSSIANAQRGQMREFQMASMQQQYANKQMELAAKAQQIESQVLPGRDQGVGRA